MGQPALQPTKAVVLVVEDEAMISDFITEVLAEQGFEVRAVDNAREALEHLCSEPVDVLFTDVNLAGDMDGAALAQRARELRRDLPVVYASGRWTVNEQRRQVPDSTFIPKPYNPFEVCALLRRLTNFPQRSSAALA